MKGVLLTPGTGQLFPSDTNNQTKINFGRHWHPELSTRNSTFSFPSWRQTSHNTSSQHLTSTPPFMGSITEGNAMTFNCCSSILNHCICPSTCYILLISGLWTREMPSKPIIAIADVILRAILINVTLLSICTQPEPTDRFELHSVPRVIMIGVLAKNRFCRHLLSAIYRFVP